MTERITLTEQQQELIDQLRPHLLPTLLEQALDVPCDEPEALNLIAVGLVTLLRSFGKNIPASKLNYLEGEIPRRFGKLDVDAIQVATTIYEVNNKPNLSVILAAWSDSSND